MFCFKLLHAGNECLAAFNGLCVIARCTEATYRTMSLDTYHATFLSCEVEEVLFQILVFVIHNEAEIHDRTVFYVCRALEEFIAVYLTVYHFSTLNGTLLHSL